MDLSHGEELKEHKKKEDNHLDRKVPRKLGYFKDAIEIKYGETQHNYGWQNDDIPIRKYITRLATCDANGNNQYDFENFYEKRVYATQTFITIYYYYIFLSYEAKSLERIFDATYDDTMEKITYINFTDYDLSGVTNFENAFRGMVRLQTIVFPKKKYTQKM